MATCCAPYCSTVLDLELFAVGFGRAGLAQCGGTRERAARQCPRHGFIGAAGGSWQIFTPLFQGMRVMVVCSESTELVELHGNFYKQLAFSLVYRGLGPG